MFIPSYILQKKFKYTSNYTFYLFEKTVINLIIEHDTETPILNLTYFQLFIQDVLVILQGMSNVLRNTITILYKESDFVKRLPSVKGKKLTKDHINSGLCYVNSKDGDLNIIIFRKDEFHKVLIHELIHLYHIVPFSKSVDDKWNMCYENIPINVNEALVELNALVINCIIVHNHFKIDSLYKLIIEEYWWCLHKIKLLLHHFGIFSLDELYQTHKWKESTHAFSYIVIKTILFHEVLYPNIHLQTNLNKVKNTSSSKIIYFTKYRTQNLLKDLQTKYNNKNKYAY